MIQKGTYLVVADNSGARELQCIHVIGSTRKRFATLGERIKCSVKKAIPGGTVKKGEVVTAVIVRTRKENRRPDGSYISFGDNAAVVVKENDPIGTRVFGPIAREVKLVERENKPRYAKIVSQAQEVL